MLRTSECSFRRTREAGARIAFESHDTEYGSREDDDDFEGDRGRYEMRFELRCASSEEASAFAKRMAFLPAALAA